MALHSLYSQYMLAVQYIFKSQNNATYINYCRNGQRAYLANTRKYQFTAYSPMV